jgi:hypothetical protein
MNSSLLGLFLSALRFMVAVIFKGLLGALSVSRDVLSNRARASVSLYLIGEGFVMGDRSVHIGDEAASPRCTLACSKSDQYSSSI